MHRAQLVINRRVFLFYLNYLNLSRSFRVRLLPIYVTPYKVFFFKVSSIYIYIIYTINTVFSLAVPAESLALQLTNKCHLSSS